MSSNKVRHNTVDVRTVEVVQLATEPNGDVGTTHKTHTIHERYADLYSDYRAQQRNVYIKPKRALRAWRKAGEQRTLNGKIHVLVHAKNRVQHKHDTVLKELGM